VRLCHGAAIDILDVGFLLWDVPVRFITGKDETVSVEQVLRIIARDVFENGTTLQLRF
jgi:hypothetical protein